jgi:hypothetical protein
MTLKEALAHPSWRKAMKSEYDSLLENDTWELVPLPPNRKALSARWVLRNKDKISPVRRRLKARLVARGYKQQYGINYTETYAPVVHWSTLRLIIAIAADLGWSISHMDVITAFLNGKLKETIFMRQPPGFEIPGFEEYVCRLFRSIYGLKQSPRTWYTELDLFLRLIGWVRSSANPNLYIMWKGPSVVILLIYVDDLLLTGNDQVLLATVKSQLMSKY